MVSKITIFEPHFDGAQFGPASIPGDKPAVDSAISEADATTESGTSSRSMGRPLLLIGAMAAGILGLRAIRRRMARGAEPVEIEAQEADAPTLKH